MIINYYGASCFKAQSGEKVLAFDPPSKKSDFKAPRFQADVVFVSSDHKDHNGFENISGKGETGEPFLVNGAGEYEIGGVSVCGAQAGEKNSIYLVEFDDIKLCHMGCFSEKELSSEVRDFLGDVDVLFMPVYEGAKKIVNRIEPKIVIPMQYKDKKELTDFLKEIGQEVDAIDKFSFKKKDIENKKEEVVVLNS